MEILQRQMKTEIIELSKPHWISNLFVRRHGYCILSISIIYLAFFFFAFQQNLFELDSLNYDDYMIQGDTRTEYYYI